MGSESPSRDFKPSGEGSRSLESTFFDFTSNESQRCRLYTYEKKQNPFREERRTRHHRWNVVWEGVAPSHTTHMYVQLAAAPAPGVPKEFSTHQSEQYDGPQEYRRNATSKAAPAAINSCTTQIPSELCLFSDSGTRQIVGSPKQSRQRADTRWRLMQKQDLFPHYGGQKNVC